MGAKNLSMLGLKYSSGGRVLAGQPRGPELDAWNQVLENKEPGVAACVCNPSAREAGAGGLLGPTG